MAMVMLELSIYMEKVGQLESYVQKFFSFKICCNRPFYNCVLSDLALDWKRGWG